MAWLPEPLPTCELPDGASVVMTGVACLTRPQETAENCTKTGPAQQEPSGMADTQQAAALAATLASAIQTAAEHAAPDLMKRLWSYTRTALMSDEPQIQSKALAAIPVGKLQAEAAEAVQLSLEMGENPRLDKQDALAKALLSWFKKDFFSWMDKPACPTCGSSTQFAGMGQPASEDILAGASRVELYICGVCGAQARFLRYNDPGRLLETRVGRCGEWANCFTLCCKAMGLEARLVYDWTDHVWTEYFSTSKGRWVHMDPCETAYDKPLLYEAGWGKKLTYVVGFSKTGVTDVSRRYTAHWPEMLKRRREAPESVLAALLALQTSRLRAGGHIVSRRALEERDTRELQELLEGPSSGTAVDLPGRQTGSEAWRAARGEMGRSTGDFKPGAAKKPGTGFVRAADEQVTARQPRRVVGGAVCSSGENPPDETAAMAFDGRAETKWLDFGGGGQQGVAWLEYRLLKGSSPLVVADYSLTSGNDEPNRDPSTFSLLGCPKDKDAAALEDADWILLDHREGIKFQARGETLVFTIPKPGLAECIAWRLVVTRTADPSAATCCQLAALDLLIQTGQAHHSSTGNISTSTSSLATSSGSTDPSHMPPTEKDSEGGSVARLPPPGSGSDFRSRVKLEFERIMDQDGGLTPSEAAAKALRNLIAAMKQSPKS